MRTYESTRALLAELDNDAIEITRLLAYNARAMDRLRDGADDPIDWGALGFTIHSMYGVAENYFLRVSKYFENGLPPDRWHRALVEKMALDIPGLRPALLEDVSDFRDAMELMKFRQRFRNLYGEDLDPDKTAAVQERAERYFGRFQAIHGSFKERLLAIAESMR